MRNITFDAFISETIALTRSMVIKIEEIALKDNTMLTNAGYSVNEDKTTWRYYMNMNGDYHETDTPMFINSIDTGESILFSKPNLEIHLATAREYRARGYWYKRLLEEHPAQTDLIKGILSPIPFSTSLNAENYKILDYDNNFVERNEYQLIPELQRRINAETNKTLQNDYLITEDLMLTVMLCNLVATVFKAICNIRFNARGTRHAHSFYVWSHIDSFGNFSKYRDSLNSYQTMWLYRNIHWLINHAGQNDNFDYLLENLLTERNIPLAKFDMVLSTEGQTESFVPTVSFRQTNLNLLQDYGTVASFIPTSMLIAKERRMAIQNLTFEDEYLSEATELSQISLFSEVPTKVLESSMMDTTNIHQDTRLTTLFNNWIYLTHKNLYRASILITNTKTGQQFRANPGDAWYLWHYLVRAATGEAPLVIEPAYYARVIKVNPPSVAQLRDIGGERFIDNVLAKDIRALSYSHGIIITPEKLMEVNEDIYAIMWKQRKLYSQFYDVNKRARVKNTVNSMLESGFARITQFTSYDALLNRYELNFTDWTPDELLIFAYEIFQSATGWGVVKVNSLGEIQSDLVGLMSELSSYTVQIVKEIIEGGDSIEIPNESFVGRPLWGDGDYFDIGDFRGVQLDSRSYLAPHLTTSLNVPLPSDNPLQIVSTSSKGVIPLFDGNHPIKVVEVDNANSLVSSIRLKDNSYCRLISPPPPEPDKDPVLEFILDNVATKEIVYNGDATYTVRVYAEAGVLSQTWFQQLGETVTPIGSESTVTITGQRTIHNGSLVWCDVKDAFGTILRSRVCKNTVLDAILMFTVDLPESYSVLYDGTAEYSVSVTSEAGGITYAWFQQIGETVTVVGENLPSLVLLNQTQEFNGVVWCEVTDKENTTITSVKCTQVVENPTLRITSDVNEVLTSYEGETHQLEVSVEAQVGVASYAWYRRKDGETTQIGSNHRQLTMTTIPLTWDGSEIGCVITDNLGYTVTSSNCALTVKESLFEYGVVTSWPYPEVGIDINSTHLPTVSDLEVTVYKVVLPSKYISMIESEEIVAYSGVTEEPFTVTKSISMIESRDIVVTQGVTEEPFTVTKSIGMIESRDVVVTQGITEEPFTVTKSIGMIESEEIVVYSGVTEEPFTVTKSIGVIETEEV